MWQLPEKCRLRINLNAGCSRPGIFKQNARYIIWKIFVAGKFCQIPDQRFEKRAAAQAGVSMQNLSQPVFLQHVAVAPWAFGNMGSNRKFAALGSNVSEADKAAIGAKVSNWCSWALNGPLVRIQAPVARPDNRHSYYGRHMP